ncbi:adhesion G-protein coupled receptor G6-like [Asterias rubens]|uniref:adhesion G-protein coupled receptor G6-like n=1 Tax=Asterias rubens TaxID=7604 RepID=UPI0014550970|nr:adhesion G-protein coupled receptor G6-like [Asterias rubens]
MPGIFQIASVLTLLFATCTVSSSSQSAVEVAQISPENQTLVPVLDHLRHNDISDILAGLNISFPLPWNTSVELPTIAPAEDIAKVRGENEGLPIVCRKDVCFESTTSDLKGNFTWNNTLAGDYDFAVCPNGVRRRYNGSDVRLAFRSCHPPLECRHLLPKPRFSCSELSYWGDTNTTLCRWDSDITNELDDILLDLLDELRADDRVVNVTSLIALLHRTNELLSNTDQLTQEDVTHTASIIDLCITSGVDDVYQLKSDVGEELVAMADNILKIDDVVLENVQGATYSIAGSLQIYAANVKLPVISRRVEHTYSNIMIDIKEPSRDVIQLPLEFSFFRPESQAETVATIRFPYYLLSGLLRDPDSKGTDPIQPMNVPVPVVRTTATVYYTNKFFMGDLTSRIPLEDTVLLYAKAYKDGVEVKQVEEPFLITFYHTHHTHDNESTWDDLQCGAARLSRNESKGFLGGFRTVDLEWDSSACTLNYTDSKQTDCICKVLDLLGLIVDIIPTPVPPQTTQEVPKDIFEFLSFPYYMTLAALCYIGYYMSLASLVLVLMTYTVFPKVRRGRPTLILINMCVSIILLIIILLASTLFSNTTIGCRIANSLRLYFILVSLMWNGVEAVHMYIALIRVFGTHTRHFVLKCSVVAWGLPSLLIGLPLAFNFEIYDGTYKDCEFVCQLSKQAFCFVFLTPMIAIVVCNSVVFVMVLWIICKMSARDEMRPLLTQLIGAVALLVLLGISWGFGASAAITYTEPESDSVSVWYFILQMLFVLSVAFQGFFIFIFHCVRYQDIRKQWAQTLRSCCRMCPCPTCCQKTKDVDGHLVLPTATPMTTPMTSPLSTPRPSNAGIELITTNHDEDTHL